MDNSASGSITREANGDISLTFRASPHGVVKYTAPPNIWASHFCDASHGGEAHLRWYSAMTFLKSSGPIDVVQVPPEQEGLHGHGSGEPPKARTIRVTDEMVTRFLTWPLPGSVCADPVASRQHDPHRTGTNLLSATEARMMLEHVLKA